jgi:hypothetical protein
MTAEQLYAELDRAGLTPPVHYNAAPHEWRETLERIQKSLDVVDDDAIEAAYNDGYDDAKIRFESEVGDLESQVSDLEEELAELKKASA